MIRLCLLLALLSAGAPPVQHSAALKWNASNQVVRYRVHRSAKSGGPYTQIASGIQVTHWTDKSVAVGQTYYYVVDARNPATNLVSGFSNQAKAVIP
jgi:hypothetical protein